jgi:uncharacterized protein
MRNHNMDFIRGIAVLGLVYMNIYTFGIFELGYIPLSVAPLSDDIIHTFSLIFVEGRFRTLFSILFGAGLYIQWQRYHSPPRLKNRLYWLILLALVHGFLLWPGDILFIYGVSGWFALRYLNSNNELLLQRAGQFILVSGVATALVIFSIDEPILVRDSAAFNDLYSLYYQSLLAHFSMNLALYTLMLVIVPFITLWACTALMLIGIYLYKQRVFTTGLKLKSVILIAVGAVLFTSLRLIAERYTAGLIYSLQELLNSIAALLMAVIYIHLAVKLCNNRATVGALLQQVGRFAFSLYICQTLMQLLLFKVLFSHWVITFNRSDYWQVATMLVVLQLLLTWLYSRYFQQGPLEYLWRHLTRLKTAS